MLLRPRSLLRVAVAGVALAAVACGEGSAPPTAPHDGLLSDRAPGASLPTINQLETGVPGFGGFYLTRDGAPAVYVTPGSDRSGVERAFAAYLREQGLPSTAVQVREGKYHWKDLEAWYQAASAEVLDLPGGVFVDNDETLNRVRIGVTDLAAAGLARAAIARLGIPDDAVVVERAEPIQPLAAATNLRGTDRPVRAGMQINFPGYLCSLGYNATSGSQKSFITASHCTNKQGGVEDTPYWQPLESSEPVQIAVEVADPVYVKGLPGCPKGKSCRYSDASRAAYLDGANQALGLIARTNGANTGSLDIVGSFTITADDLTNSVTSGQTVHKVGRTTGWTSGQVSSTCVNTGVSGTRIVQLCQTFVSSSNTIVLGGDSGSGVFQVISGTDVRLVGSLWGGNGSGTLFVYSPLKNVVQELGPLTTH
jgi:hypothetical protein